MEPISYLFPRFQERRRLFRQRFAVGLAFPFYHDNVDRPARALLVVKVAVHRKNV
jgi:hypothetical protein